MARSRNRYLSDGDVFSVLVDVPPQLRNVGGQLERRQRRFLGELGDLVVEAARRNIGAGHEGGRLARSIRRHVLSDSVAEVRAGAAHARAQERGAYITPVRGLFLRFRIEGRWIFAKAVRLKPKLYLHRAVKQRRRLAQRAFDKVYGDLLRSLR